MMNDRRFIVRRTSVCLFLIALLTVGIWASTKIFIQSATVHNPRPASTINARTNQKSKTTSGADPGSLPQTDTFPNQINATFLANIEKLWIGIKTDHGQIAKSAFFPKAAYIRLKMIADPASDYKTRLLDQFYLDISAAHRYLGNSLSKDQFLGIVVPSWNANWVTPGRCYSNTGYFHVPNSRLLYRRDGQVYSIGIASLISWRGQWYVVHMGAVNALPGTGIVNKPRAGIGSFGIKGGC